VSLARPFDDFAYDDKRAYTHWYPFRLAAFLASRGYAVDFCNSFDLHNDSQILSGYQLFISVGHDEYWSKEMRDHVEQFVANGGNAVYFSGNVSWWQVRFADAGATMVGYKNPVEDPSVVTNPAVTTAHFSSAPTNRPENSLTGVSFRRGIEAGGLSQQYTVVGQPDPFLAGVGATIGDATYPVLSIETDGLDFTVNGGVYTPTGNDGSPVDGSNPGSGFKILAVSDQRAVPGLSQAGVSIMGYFYGGPTGTVGGTVFTTGTCDWVFGLGDGVVGNADAIKVTENVLQLLTVPRTGPAAAYLSLEYPTSSWTTLDPSVGAAQAIAASPVGQLLIARPAGTLQWRDPERYSSSSWQPHAAPAVSNILALACDSWGRRVNALRAGTNPAQWRTPRPTSNDPWQPLADSIGGYGNAGIAIAENMFAFTSEIGDLSGSLYWKPGPGEGDSWVPLGRVPPGTPTAIAAFNARLYLTTSSGKLLTRDVSTVDLVWSQIGTCPTDIFSMAAYFGRLFALRGTSSSTTLSWRATVPDAAFAFKEPSQLFYKTTGDVAIGTLTQAGSFTNTGSLQIDPYWTHLTRANDGFVFFYSSSDHSAIVYKFSSAGAITFSHPYGAGAFSAWTHVVYCPPCVKRNATKEHVLFYNNTNHVGIVGHFAANGTFVQDHATYTTFSLGWTLIASTALGNIVFYNGTTGAWVIASFDDNGTLFTDQSGTGAMLGCTHIAPVGQTFMLLYKQSTGAGELWEMFPTRVATSLSPAPPAGRIPVPSSNGIVLLYDPTTGQAQAQGARWTSKARTSSELHGLRDYTSGSFGAWDLSAAVGVLS
jgi:hypothetical protein